MNEQVWLAAPFDRLWAGRDPFELYAEFNAVSGICNDPCLLDTFIAATRFMGGEPARPWWAYTAERKARLGGGD